MKEAGSPCSGSWSRWFAPNTALCVCSFEFGAIDKSTSSVLLALGWSKVGREYCCCRGKYDRRTQLIRIRVKEIVITHLHSHPSAQRPPARSLDDLESMSLQQKINEDQRYVAGGCLQRHHRHIPPRHIPPRHIPLRRTPLRHTPPHA